MADENEVTKTDSHHSGCSKSSDRHIKKSSRESSTENFKINKRTSLKIFGPGHDPKHGNNGSRSSGHGHHSHHSHLQSLAGALLGIRDLQSEDIRKFEHILKHSDGFTISTSRKYCTEKSLLGKSGYEIKEESGEKFGVLLSKTDPSTCYEMLCSRFGKYENDPICYYIAAQSGSELLTVAGLDEESGTEDVVLITQNHMKDMVGSVMYGRLGVTDSISEASTIWECSSTVPISVLNIDGELNYIFRDSPSSTLSYTEILTTDGNATVIAHISFEYSKKRVPSTAKSNKNSFPSALRVEFDEDVPLLDKTLIMGVAIVQFNRWLKKHSRSKCRCTIL